MKEFFALLGFVQENHRGKVPVLRARQLYEKYRNNGPEKVSYKKTVVIKEWGK